MVEKKTLAVVAVILLCLGAYSTVKRILPPQPPSGSSLDTLVKKGRKLGYSVYGPSQDEHGKGYLFIDRSLNPGASEKTGAAQDGALFVSDSGGEHYFRFHTAGDLRLVGPLFDD